MSLKTMKTLTEKEIYVPDERLFIKPFRIFTFNNLLIWMAENCTQRGIIRTYPFPIIDFVIYTPTQLQRSIYEY